MKTIRRADGYGAVVTNIMDNGARFSRDIITGPTALHEKLADDNAPRSRAATIWRIEHRDDYANTVF